MIKFIARFSKILGKIFMKVFLLKWKCNCTQLFSLLIKIIKYIFTLFILFVRRKLLNCWLFDYFCDLYTFWQIQSQRLPLPNRPVSHSFSAVRVGWRLEADKRGKTNQNVIDNNNKKEKKNVVDKKLIILTDKDLVDFDKRPELF